MKDTHREDLHPLLLVGAEALIERLPRIGELFESGGTLRSGIGASAQQFNRINGALLTEPFCHCCNPLVPCLCPGADSLLDSGPIFRLLRRQLQHRLDNANSRIGQDVELGLAGSGLRRGLLLNLLAGSRLLRTAGLLREGRSGQSQR